MTDYDGLDVVDADGEKIGTVDRTFVDGNGEAKYVGVKMGSLFAKHHLVPVADARIENNALCVPYSKGTIGNSPDVSGGNDTLDAATLDSVAAFYQGAPRLMPQSAPENPPPATAADEVKQKIKSVIPGHSDDTEVPVVMAYNTGDIRDNGNFIDVPIVEQAPGQDPVVKEILRIPKKRGEAIPETADQQRVVTTAAGQS